MNESPISSNNPPTALFLMAHGAPTSVEDIPEYLKNIRGGTESSPEVVQMVRERYERIGGSSPLLEITRRQAEALERYMNQGDQEFKVYFGMRNWSPYIRDGVRQMVQDGVRRVLALCLAPHYSKWSTERYIKAFYEALESCGGKNLEVRFITSWPNHPCLIDAFAGKYEDAVSRIRQKGHDRIYTIFTVHSIPAESLELGDPYDQEYDLTIQGLVDRVKPYRWYKAYQSQGMIPVPWLGPSVESVLDKIARYGPRAVLVVPLGFVSDHIEILYDIDVCFKDYASERKLELFRTESMNDSASFIEALGAVFWEHLV